MRSCEGKSSSFQGAESEEEKGLLRGLEGALTRKNVSYYFLADRTIGIDPTRKEREEVHLVLRRHLRDLISFLTRTMPSFMKDCRPGTCSFRPLQAAGRKLKPRAADDLVHLDAGAYGATHGDRILRFLVNQSLRAARLVHPRNLPPHLRKVRPTGGESSPPWASGDRLDDQIEGTGSMERNAYTLLERFYGLFGLPATAIPFTANGSVSINLVPKGFTP